VRMCDPGKCAPYDIERATPDLEIVLDEGPEGCVARIRGELLRETCGGLWGVESILVNEAAIALDLSGLRAIDRAGLEALLMLMNAVQASGRALSIGNQTVRNWPTRIPVGRHSESSNASGKVILRETVE
jgi:ABC-type transporter Mla MlaB component